MVQLQRTVIPLALEVCTTCSAHLLLFIHILGTRSSATADPCTGCHQFKRAISVFWEHRAECELQPDSAWLGRTWRPLQASRVARTVLQRAGTA